jgi:flavin reductase (DIM6/NTAB) family NADH-FMN oxidoreductase RutF
VFLPEINGKRMEYDLSALSSRDAYVLLTRLVVPRPIAWVTSLDAEGVVNAAPFSFFNLLGSDPLTVAIGVGGKRDGEAKDTARNIERSGEFVINLVDEVNAEAMNITAVEFPHGVSELQAAGLTPTASAKIAVPRIEGAPAALECRLEKIVTVGGNRILLGVVVYVALREGEMPETLQLIARMGGGGGYVRTTDRFDLPRITVEQWQNRGDG